MVANEAPHSIVSTPMSFKSKYSKPNIFVRGFRSIFGYRKTSLSFFIFITSILVYGLTIYDNNLELSVGYPNVDSEKLALESSWAILQTLGLRKHPYGSQGNKYVHSFLEQQIQTLINQPYIEYDNDLNNTNFFFGKDISGRTSYYESNNLIVRINGTNPDLPALLLSAHFDSVPSSFGVTDDGAGIASLLGTLEFLSKQKQPIRTIVFNFNNNEEFGLFGAQTFLNHPWAKKVKYFINLEGTGQGGKAILFRGTDYGITKFYNSIRYPYASSIFQQAFNSRVIHSDTDYTVYEAGGLRGIDVAFFKPRDIYHTNLDDIRHTSKLALWHMLSTSLDFVGKLGYEEVDLDNESHAEQDETIEYASYITFLNHFFIISVSKLVVYNIILLVIIPVISMMLLIVIFGYKQNWRLGFINVVKFPISLGVSLFILNFVTKVVAQTNEFLPNSNSNALVVLLTAVFVISNYLILNGINLIFRNYKIIQHDEKLVVILQISFIYWLMLIVVTAGLAKNRKGNDHTGKALVTILFLMQSLASLWGLLGWCIKPSKKELEWELSQAENQPLLVQQADYGTETQPETQPSQPNSDSTSLISVDSYTARKDLLLIAKTFSYDWSIQYLILVPIPLLIFYNNGYLLLEGLKKAIQESLKSEVLIYKSIMFIAASLVLPLYPFIFKINRVLIWVVLFIIAQGFVTVFLASPFDIDNPMKLRFVQSVNVTDSLLDSYVNVRGRIGIDYESVLSDVPSLKQLAQLIICDALGDGMSECYYKSSLPPKIIDSDDFSKYLSIDILKNSSSNDYPYGLLTGEIKIHAPLSSSCSILFHSAKTKDFPVKTVIKYNQADANSSVSENSVSEGLTTDKNGNYIYKNIDGIPSWTLWKLNTNAPYHIGFQWLPNLIDDNSGGASNSLKLDVSCTWSDLGDNDELVPAYQELIRYSPKWVTWANFMSGMVSVTSSIEI